MSESDDEGSGEEGAEEESAGKAPDAEGAPATYGSKPRVGPIFDPKALGAMTTLRPVFDPAVLGAIKPLQIQTADIIRAIGPITGMSNLGLAKAVVPGWSKIDLTPILPAVKVAHFLPKVDFATLLPEFRLLLEGLHRHEPPNWPRGIDFDRLVEVIRDDGLPLVWVPRSDLVQDVVDADGREARVAVLLAHVPELVQDCRGVLPGVTHSVLTGQQQLAERCVEALEQGHHEAAQALAVAVVETAVSRSLKGNYTKIKQQVLFDPELVPYTQLRLRAALAPIYQFYTEWNPRSPHPAPEAISRHVTVHHADPSHYTRANSLVAVLLACSVLRALQELQELAEASGLDQAAA